MSAQSGDDHRQELLPVIRIHMQLLRVHHTQCFVGILDVVQVLHSSIQPSHHCLSMCGHLSVAHDGGGAGQIAKQGEVPLSPGVHDENLGSDFIHVDFSPQAHDGTALSICPVDHVDSVEVFSELSVTSSDDKPY
uniref:Uncharacterized protein n=1 Tax=Myripristis murdjan TaxID=586833 RepID=A0A668ACV9_9TELE